MEELLDRPRSLKVLRTFTRKESLNTAEFEESTGHSHRHAVSLKEGLVALGILELIERPWYGKSSLQEIRLSNLGRQVLVHWLQIEALAERGAKQAGKTVTAPDLSDWPRAFRVLRALATKLDAGAQEGVTMRDFENAAGCVHPRSVQLRDVMLRSGLISVEEAGTRLEIRLTPVGRQVAAQWLAIEEVIRHRRGLA